MLKVKVSIIMVIIIHHVITSSSSFSSSSLQASRVDKLQTELGSHRDKLEEASRLQIRLREMKAKSEQVLEAKAMLEDEVESLQDKVATLGE